MLISLVVTIVFAGIAECLCTPFENWFLSLNLPSSFVSADFHNVVWLFEYIAMAFSMSKDLVKKDKFACILWVIVYIFSCLGLFSLFSLHNLILLVVFLVLCCITLLIKSIYTKHSSISSAVIAAWYIYLTAVAVVMCFKT